MPKYHDNITILFADVCGYTKMCAEQSIPTTVNMLNALFTAFDELLDDYNVQQVNIIGDAYMAVAENAVNMLEFASAILIEASYLNVNIKIGISSGPAISTKMGKVNQARSYYGDTVNMASRMESHGFPNTIHVSQQFVELYADQTSLIHMLDFKQLGVREIKGKGKIATYLYCKIGEWEAAFNRDLYEAYRAKNTSSRTSFSHTDETPQQLKQHSSFTHMGYMKSNYAKHVMSDKPIRTSAEFLHDINPRSLSVTSHIMNHSSRKSHSPHSSKTVSFILSQQKSDDAARVIQRYWRKYKEDKKDKEHKEQQKHKSSWKKIIILMKEVFV
jgi:class 3 adenylate cyclase